jgi:hypothetical protein
MTLSKDVRHANLVRALEILLDDVGEGYHAQCLIAADDAKVAEVLPTTWAELVERGFVVRRDTNGPDLYTLTARGWTAALVVTGHLTRGDVPARLQQLVAALKATVKAVGRHEEGIADVSALAGAANASEDWALNALEGDLLSAAFPGRRWRVRLNQPLVWVAVDFGHSRP